MDFLAALDDRDRLDIVDWSERREYRDTQAEEALQVLTDLQALQVFRDTVAPQASQEVQESPEERESRENLDFQDLRLTSRIQAPQFKVRPVSPVVLEYPAFVETKDLQVSQAFQEPQEVIQEQQWLDFLVFLGPQDPKERRAAPGHRAMAPRDRLVPPDCLDHQANLDLPDPPVRVSQASPSRDSLDCPAPGETAEARDSKE